MDRRLLSREAQLEAESYELEERLRRAKERNLPQSIILSIESDIRINNQKFDALMCAINSELERGYY